MTQKASEKVTERVLRRETLLSTSVEETNRHTFDTPHGPAHTRGVYQWITRFMRPKSTNTAQNRLRIMIPEPGAFLLELSNARTAATELEKPPAFEITPISSTR